MPIYEYACPKCGEFEVTQRITEPALKKCPTCKSTKVKKLISNTSFQLKGSGWYITDYARKGGGGKGESKSDGKSETKSESKSDSSTTESSSNSSETKTSTKTGKASQAA